MAATLKEQAAELLGIELAPEQEAQFELYARELAVWNAHTNLTAITDPDGVRVRHFLDSLTISRVVPMKPGLRMIDVGTGAGFPGLALCIAFPYVEVVLMEATGKKVAFLNHMIAQLNLAQAHTLHARAEDAGHMAAHRAAYDAVVARSVARLPALVEYLLPLCKVGGRCVAMKGATAAEECRDAERAIKMLGGMLERTEKIVLPGVADEHYLVVIDKTAVTPPSYPRKPGVPTRKPLS